VSFTHVVADVALLLLRAYGDSTLHYHCGCWLLPAGCYSDYLVRLRIVVPLTVVTFCVTFGYVVTLLFG